LSATCAQSTPQSALCGRGSDRGSGSGCGRKRRPRSCVCIGADSHPHSELGTQPVSVQVCQCGARIRELPSRTVAELPSFRLSELRAPLREIRQFIRLSASRSRSRSPQFAVRSPFWPVQNIRKAAGTRSRSRMLRGNRRATDCDSTDSDSDSDS